jgi:hypothetical protein
MGEDCVGRHMVPGPIFDPYPVVAHPGHDGSVCEDDPVSQAPTPPSGSPQSPIGGAATPDPGRAAQQRSNPERYEGETGPNPDAIDAVASEVPKIRAHVLRRLMILLGLALVALTAGIWALVIFPVRPTITNPTPFSLAAGSFIPSSDIYLTIAPVGAQSTLVLVSVLPPVNALDKTEEKTGYVALLTSGDFPVSCEPAALTTCLPGIISLQFRNQDGRIAPNQETVTIKDLQIDATSNGESAIVEMPAVQFLSSDSGGQLTVSFYVPNADTYDWSIPPFSESQDYATWSEQASAVPLDQASEITGINHQAENHDNDATFISGILLGVTGAAVICVVQEGLHMVFDDREDRRPKPSRPSTSS